MISIHPRFAEAIFKGEKKVEFRKLNIPKNIEYVVLYLTAPERMIAGYFSVKKIVDDHILNLWKRYNDISGISEEFFLKYYSKNDIGRGILVGKVDVFETPIPLEKVLTSNRPPQSFTYIQKTIWNNLKRQKKRAESTSSCVPKSTFR